MLLFMGVVVEYYITAYVDTFGYILVSDNTLVPQQMNHIDSSPHLIWYYVDYGTVKIKFIHSEEKLAEPFTNNLSNIMFQYITTRYVHRD